MTRLTASSISSVVRHYYGLQRPIAKDEQPSTDGGEERCVHEAHRRLGFEIVRNPDLPNTTRHPDVLCIRRDGEFYLEATVVGESMQVVAQARRERILIDLINAAYHPDFSVMVYRVAPASQPVARKDVVRAVEEWLAALDWRRRASGWLLARCPSRTTLR